jgi:CBS domain-containing protein
MAAISELIRGREVFCAIESDNVLQVVGGMSERNIGAVPVLRDGQLVGIFTERDLMKRVVAGRLDPERVTVGEVMSTSLLVVPPEASTEECMVLLKQHGIRHLPVCQGRALVGLVSIRDLLLYEVDELDVEMRAMRAYIQSS